MTTSDDDLSPDSRPEHPLAPHLDQLALACEALQTWASDVASRLGREGPDAQPSAQELGEGRRLGAQVSEALEEVRDRATWEG